MSRAPLVEAEVVWQVLVAGVGDGLDHARHLHVQTPQIGGDEKRRQLTAAGSTASCQASIMPCTNARLRAHVALALCMQQQAVL